jgi:hypothetical protein
MIRIMVIISIFRTSLAKREMCGERPCCQCGTTYGVCILGDESPERGFGCKSKESCSHQCPGNYSWMQLYNESRRKEARIYAKCEGNPSEHWQPATPPGIGRFAVAFAGALRNFAATYHSWETNLIMATGSDLVDLYFHVWDDEYNPDGTAFKQARNLAMNSPYTKGFVMEHLKNYLQYINEDLPNLPDQPPTESWLGAVVKEIKPNEIPPFRVGAGYSQWRKVYLCLQMILKSKIVYGLILRARPDHTVLEPFDLSQLHRDYYKYKSVQRTKGHFIAIGERSKQVKVSPISSISPLACTHTCATIIHAFT